MAKTVVAYKSEGKDNPVFEVVDTSGAITVKVDDVQVLAEQQAAISGPTGGTTVDVEARTAINSILSALRAHGIIAT